MPRLTLPDATSTELPEGEPVGSALPAGVVAARVDGELRDLSHVPAADAAVEPVDRRSDDGLHVLRHSAAHVLAQAVCQLWPGTQLGIGPAIADGFYYDLAISRARLLRRSAADRGGDARDRRRGPAVPPRRGRTR